MTIQEQIQHHLDNKKYCRVERQIAENTLEENTGYIVDCSEDFVLLQEEVNFKIEGYCVIPILSISKIRFNNSDNYIDKILRWEKVVDQVSNKYNIDLTDWSTIFTTIKKAGFNVIVENENPDVEAFVIGRIIGIDEESVDAQHFDSEGFLENELTIIPYDEITIAKFDSAYINVFSKYLREREE